MGVVIKPAGVECYSSANGGHGKNTVKSALPFALKPPAVGVKGAYRLPRAMHRLDRLTSGLFVVAKTRPAAVELARCFAEREVEKEYTAIVMEPKPQSVVVGDGQGLVAGAKTPAKVGVEGTVDEPCFGKHAVTRYSVDESFSSPSFPSPPMDPPIDPPIDPSIELEEGLRERELRFHLLKLKPETGRKHQLRLHCSHSLGMPIVGDSLYDNRSEIAKALRVAGLFLHASSLQMKHPVYTSRPEEIGVVLGRQGSRCCIGGLIMAHMSIYGNNH
jgi:23S rRNA-/tRNA-specific pseudouridylate synthase